MTIRELIEELEYAAELSGDGVEVRYASQPSYPFEYSLGDVAVMTKETREDVLRNEMRDEGMTDEEINKWLQENNETGEDVVYLAEGSQLGYLPADAKESLGW